MSSDEPTTPSVENVSDVLDDYQSLDTDQKRYRLERSADRINTLLLDLSWKIEAGDDLDRDDLRSAKRELERARMVVALIEENVDVV